MAGWRELLTYRNSLLLMLAVNFVAIILTVAGLADATSYCYSQPGTAALLAGFKLEYRSYALTRLTNFGGTGFTCGKYWEFQWTIWALQITWFIMFCLSLWRRVLGRYLHGLSSVVTVCTAWHCYNADDLAHLYEKTEGELKTAGIVSFVGIVGMIITNFLILFLAGGLKHQEEAEKYQRLGTMQDKESKSELA